MDGPKETRDAIRPEVVAHKPEIMAHLLAAANDAVPADCAGALRSRSGGLYLSWGLPRPGIGQGLISDSEYETIKAKVISQL